MRSGLLTIGVVAAVVTASGSYPAAQKGPALPEILQAAASHVAQLSEQLQAVSAEEEYLQLEVSGGAMRTTRKLVSDVVFFGAGSGQLAFYRDVFSKDGKPVRERESRLLKLFRPPSNETLQDAQSLTEGSVAHYVSKTMTVVDEIMGPLALLRAENQSRATFKLDGIKTTGGVDVATIRFTEGPLPHLINSPIDDPATGRLLIDARTGVVRQTEWVFSNKQVNIRATVVYALEPTFKLWLPSTLVMQADVSAREAGNQLAGTQRSFDVRESLEGRATYSKFKTLWR